MSDQPIEFNKPYMNVSKSREIISHPLKTNNYLK